ncbi:MAG: hypothetical protein EOO89_17025 [Pedobacter sp.]|nr:MAG: hypothetical protein EOO89_17025 [Pedobacter sp.]
MDELIDITFHKKDKIAFRAAWILEYICIEQPHKCAEALPYFTERFSEQNNLSAMRHYTKIMCHITAPRSPQIVKHVLNDLDTTTVVETMFTWLIDPATPVAVKANCMEALANLIPGHPWIKETLSESIEHLVDKESVAFFGRAKKVRQRLKRA